MQLKSGAQRRNRPRLARMLFLWPASLASFTPSARPNAYNLPDCTAITATAAYLGFHRSE